MSAPGLFGPPPDPPPKRDRAADSSADPPTDTDPKVAPDAAESSSTPTPPADSTKASPEPAPPESGAREADAGGETATPVHLPPEPPADTDDQAPAAAGEPSDGDDERSEAVGESSEAAVESSGAAGESVEAADESVEAAGREPSEAEAPADGDTGKPAAEPAEPAEPAAPAPPPPAADPPPDPKPAPTAAPAAGNGRRGDYEVLALRYRPQTFTDLVGQEPIARTLRNAIRRDRIGHAFLFAGQRGIGKTTTARILAKALNCSATPGPNPDPCGACPSCREVAGGFSRDVPEIDGASNNSVHKAREIIEAARYTPVRDRFKIYLVDEVHMLSLEAFNALLKTLEEPPKHVKFIFATTEIHKIPDTILSRCQEFEFRAVSPQQVEERLRFIVSEQGLKVSDDALARIARFGQGSMRDAISALDQVLAAVDGEVTAAEVGELLGIPDASICRRAAAAILEGDRRAVFEVVEELVAGGRDLKHFVTLFMHYLRDVVVCRAAPDRPALLEWPDEREALTGFAAKFSEEDLLRSLDVLTRALDGLRWSPEPRFHLEMALLKLVEMPRLAAFEELLARVEAPAASAPSAAPAPSVPSAPPAASPAPSRARASSGAPAASASPGNARAPAEAPAASAGGEPDPPEPPVAREVWQDYLETFGGQVVEVRPFPEEPGESGTPPKPRS